MGWADEIERASKCSLTGLWVWTGRKERRSLLDTPKVDWAYGGVMDHDQGPSTSHDSHAAVIVGATSPARVPEAIIGLSASRSPCPSQLHGTCFISVF